MSGDESGPFLTSVIRHLASALLLYGLAAGPAHASPRTELEQTRKEMEQSKAHQAELSEQTKLLESELDDIRQKLVQLAASMQSGEAALSEAEENLRGFDKRLQEKNDALRLRRKNLDALVMAALRLSRMPPEAVMTMPGDMAQTMTAARALAMASDGIRQETKAIGLELADLQKLKDQAEKTRDGLRAQQEVLGRQRRELDKSLAARKALQEKLGREQGDEAENLARLAKKAEDVQELMSSLEKEEKRYHYNSWLKPDERAPQGSKGALRPFAGAKGQVHPPVAGKVVQVFGAARGPNETSKGIVITARPGAQVTAPYDGEVVFAGSFKGYGQMVIIRHNGDFHTLLAGLAKIDTETGQFLLEGEPIGAMGEDASGDHPGNRLYVELRKDGQPIDPAPWIHGLSTRTKEEDSP